VPMNSHILIHWSVVILLYKTLMYVIYYAHWPHHNCSISNYYNFNLL